MSAVLTQSFSRQKLISNQQFEQMLIDRARHFTRLGRSMAVDQLIAAEDHGHLMQSQSDAMLQGIGKHLCRFVNRILFEV